MPHRFTKSRARKYAGYTGLSYQAALERVASLRPSEAPIAHARGAQGLLEGRVFSHLGVRVDYFPHPLGVAAVRPEPGGITLALDPSATRHGHPLARHVVEGLLPAEPPGTAEGENLIGVRGIRIAHVTRKALHLTLAGTTARLTLTSRGNADWRDALDRRTAELREAGARPCWSQDRTTRAEEALERSRPRLCRAEDEEAWLPSGLLRRVGLFHTVSAAYRTDYWWADGQLKIELRHEHGVPMPHDAFVDHLTDPRWGMPLTLRRRSCHCGAPWLHHAYDQQCTITLAHRTNAPGELQLRFTSNYLDHSTDGAHARLLSVQADPVWLRRVLPSHSRCPA